MGTLALIAAVVKKFVDFVRQLRGKDTSAVVTQLLAWVLGIVAVYLTAHVDFASAVNFANMSLDQMGLLTQTVLGILVGSVGSVGKDALKALDNNQTEAAPKLVPDTYEK
jgi:hypothetical protein